MVTDQEETVEALRRFDLFAALDDELLAALADSSKIVGFEAGDVLARQGTGPDEMCVILEGDVELVRNGQAVAVVGPGSMCGDLSVLSGEPHTVDVVAKTPGRRVIIGVAEFRSAVRFHPEVAMEVIRVLAYRFHSVLEIYDPNGRRAKTA